MVKIHVLLLLLVSYSVAESQNVELNSFKNQSGECFDSQSFDSQESNENSSQIVIVSEETFEEEYYVNSPNSTQDYDSKEVIYGSPCPENEVFNGCINSGCTPQNCSQLGYPVPCILLEPKFCQKGCTCAEGFLRSTNGTCVLLDDCDVPCGGDPNAVPGCGTNCGCHCSDIGNIPVACKQICDPNGCDCKPGFLFDDQTNKCVSPDQCSSTSETDSIVIVSEESLFEDVSSSSSTENCSKSESTEEIIDEPACQENEVFNSCVNSGCFPQNCSQLGYPVPCVKLDPKYCRKGCTCQDGYLRSRNGTCVLKENCDSPCGGDPNSTPGCGSNCGRRCSNYNKGLLACPFSCNINGCDCKKGYVFDDNINKCVKPEECTQTCKKNEVFNSCTNSGCVPQNCSQLGYPVPCVRLDPKFCKKGCTCEEGYLRSENGTCVLKEDCNTPCGGDPNAVPGCGNNCGSRCSDIGKIAVPCARICNINGCDCKPGFVLDNKTNKCVRPDQCTIKPSSCPVNEEYSTCSNAICRAQNCSQKDEKFPCNAVSKCDKGCVCKETYFRGANGTCVPKNQCPTLVPIPTCPINEEYSNCRAQYCSQINQLIPCNAVSRCDKGCVRKENFYRGANGTCIPKKQCPNSCGGDPNAVPGCGVNCGKRCSDIGKGPVACILVCYINGCDCKPGYVLDDNTKKCVRPDECSVKPPLSCPVNEEYSNCSNAICRAQYCSQINQSIPCNAMSKCDEGCVCKENYYRGANGTCVPKNQCPTSCGGDPNAVPGCGVNCGKRCSDIGKGPVACILVCYVNGCDCKPGYVLDDNTKKCVRPDECSVKPPLSCPVNEEYSNCSNAICRAQYCSQTNQSIPCNAVSKCDEGCVCKENYYRGANGTCVPKNQCPTSCGGDPNAVPGCGTNCGKRCSDIGKAPGPCPLICNLNGCDCKPGFVLDDNTKKCVKPDKCSAVCKQNEVYSSCINGGCDRRNCSQLKEPQLCIDLIEGGCIGGCVCEKGYLRNGAGVCVLENKCPEISCLANEVFNSCAPPLDTISCINGTIKKSDLIQITLCTQRCVCQRGFVRNIKGECISEANCQKCKGPKEYYSCGGFCDNECAKLSTQNQTNCPVVNIKCNEKCYCEEGHARDKNNVCIPIGKCPVTKPTCPINEEYNECSNAICRAQNCSQKGQPIACPAVSKCDKGCICKENYLRNQIGVCVPQDQCKKISCSVNEVFNSCAPPLDTISCINGTIKKSDVIQITLCTQRCVCQRGFVRNIKGECISEANCQKCKGPKEYYSCGGFCDNECAKLSTQNQTNCPVVNIKCNEKCYCEEGHARDKNNVCIPIGKCPATEVQPTCGHNEEYSSCVNGICRAQNCTDKYNTIACPQLQEGSCRRGCVCKEHFLRNATGFCVPDDQCAVCPEGERYSTCPAKPCDAEYCPKSRNDPQACISTRECSKPRCVCGFNQKRERPSGKCIPISQCPSFPCGPNEEYNSCPPVCPGQNCTDFLNNSTCPRFRIGIVVPCKPACRCIKNYYRNLNGICIKESKCSTAVCGRNEEYSTCKNSLCGGQNCSDLWKKFHCPLVTKENCQGGCICKPNYLRKNGVCVPQDQCQKDEPDTGCDHK